MCARSLARSPRAVLALTWLLAASVLAASRMAAGGVAADQRAELELPAVLANVRAAVGYERLSALAGHVLLEGDATVAGERGAYRCAFTPTGRFREQNGGPVAAMRGFDGAISWDVDWTGMPRVIVLEEREISLAWMWIRSHRWLAPEEPPFRITLVPDATDASTVELALALRGGALELRLAIDRASWLPRTCSSESSGEQERLILQDYEEALGFKLARAIDLEQRSVRREYRVRAVSLVPDGDVRADYALPTERPQDTQFDAGASSEVEVTRAPTGHLLVRPEIDGEERGWFILDTGAATLVIDEKVADQAGMETFGRAAAVGVGGPVGARFRRGRSLRLGPFSMARPIYGGIDLAPISKGMRVPIAGVCGYDVFSRVVAEIDMASPRLSLHDPDRYTLARGAWQELTIAGRHPCVPCTFAGGEGLFRLDTGAAPDTVTFNAPAVARLQLLEGRETEPAMLAGVGGMTEARNGVLDWFELGGHRFEAPRVNFATAQRGAFAGRSLAGNVGGKFMSPFVIVLDYARRRIAFVARPPEPR